MRTLSITDNILIKADFVLKTICGGHRGDRAYPPQSKDSLTPEEKRHSIGLMRVNNVGEVCAQALYEAQALATSNKEEVFAIPNNFCGLTVMESAKPKP